MFRYLPVVASLSCAIAGCVTDDDVTSSSLDQAVALSVHREHVTGDIYHYELVIPVGSSPNAGIRLHRVVRELAPFVPRRTARAVMMMHGDFSTFTTNFVPTLGEPASPAPGLAPYLAARGFDVWGLDRRWTLPATDGDISDLSTMGVAQELDDIRSALAFSRATRFATGDGNGKIALLGFSHGAQLAYVYASVEAARPAAQRHVGALVPLDFYGAFGPAQTELAALTCDNSGFEYELVAEGEIDAPNTFFINLGVRARTAPDAPTPVPFLAGLTNREAMLFALGQTYVFAPFSPFYHLLSPILEGDAAVGLRDTPEAAATAWLAGATPHQSMIEAADLDALLCPTAAQPVDAPLSRIRVPVLYLGAAGGVGALGIYSTTQVSSADVTSLVVQRFGAERVAEDFGHGDLLFATDAPALAWQPLASWLAHH